MSLNLTAELEDLVESKVKSGNYGSAADVIREALGLLEERDQMLLLQKQEISEKITEGLNSLRRGEAVDGESVFDRIDAELDELERAGHK
jgi:antitoxin ParD1/3/4